MILEELMHERFATYSFFKDQMAVYAGLPAVFYQGAPDDRQKGWEREQYPRIVYTIDMQADEERKSADAMLMLEGQMLLVLRRMWDWQ